jgi:hypothetical protein
VIQQRINSGQFFNGTMPADDATPDASFALYKHAAANAGGLFLWATREPIVLTQFLIDLGANGDVTVSVVNLDPTTVDSSPSALSGETLVVDARTAVPRLFLNETNFRVVLLPFQALRLVTTNSGAAQIAQLTAYLARPRQW